MDICPGHMASVGLKRSRPDSIIVNECQKGNPVLQHIRNVVWEYGDTVADYEVGRTSAALFLSLRYHKLHPNYIYDRIKQLGQNYSLRLLLILVDTGDFSKSLRELHRVSVILEFTVILAWSNEEAARYLETFKAFEHKTSEAIKLRSGEGTLERLHLMLSNVRPINKTNVLTLSTRYKSVAEIVCAEEKDLLLLPGFGPNKAKTFVSAMQSCFDPNLCKPPS